MFTFEACTCRTGRRLTLVLIVSSLVLWFVGNVFADYQGEYDEGMERYDEERFDLAIDCFGRAIKMAGEDDARAVQATVMRAVCHQLRAASTTGRNAEAHLTLAIADFDQADILIERVNPQTVPWRAFCHTWSGVVCEHRFEIAPDDATKIRCADAALDHFEKVLALTQEPVWTRQARISLPRLCVAYAYWLINKGKYDRGQEVLRAANKHFVELEKYKRDASLYLLWAKSLRLQAERAFDTDQKISLAWDAIAKAEQGLQLTPPPAGQDAHALRDIIVAVALGFGPIARARGNFDKAVKFIESIPDYRNNAQAMYQLGTCYETQAEQQAEGSRRKGDLDGAKAHYKTALALGLPTDLEQAAKDALRRIDGPKPEPRNELRVALDGSERYMDLQSALKAARPGDRVVLCWGTYTHGPGHSINVENLEIVGESRRGYRRPIIEGGRYSSVLTVNGGNIVVRGLMLRGKANGMATVNVASGKVILDNCELTSAGACVDVSTSAAADCVLRACHLHDAAIGLRVYEGCQATAQECHIYNNERGIEIQKAALPVLERCIIHDNKVGIWLSPEAGGVLDACQLYLNGENAHNSPGSCLEIRPNCRLE